MPELPEVETVRRGLEPILLGQTIKRVDLRRGDLRRPFSFAFDKRLTGRRIVKLDRRAKYIIAELDDGNWLVMHLGMSGSFRIECRRRVRSDGTSPAKAAHDHVVFHLGSGAQVIYNDPRRFGSMDILTTKALADSAPFKAMGIEPLGPELTAEYLAEQLGGKKTTVKAALLDQRIVAGLGNIYVCEALWRSGISPLRQAGSLVDRRDRPSASCERLPGAIKSVLKAAIASGGSSLRNHIRTDGSLGTFQHQFKVYDREGLPCRKPGCRGTVGRVLQSGRSTFHCPSCQR